MVDKINVIVGQSGVGKSSILNQIQPDLKLRTGEISESTGKGVHTTTFAALYSLEDGGFVAEGVWVVGGTVTHFGHRHFRQNRYDARVTLVPVERIWKIRSIDLFDEERLR